MIDVFIGVQERFDEACVTTARVAQALTIDGFDRLVRARDFVAQAVPAPLSPDQKLIRRLVSHHADLVDRQYALVARLLCLHREFAQRLFDVMGAHESQAITRETSATLSTSSRLMHLARCVDPDGPHRAVSSDAATGGGAEFAETMPQVLGLHRNAL